MKTQQPTYKVSIFAPPFALIRSSFLLRIELLSSSRTFGLALYHASHTRLYISSFKHGSWLPISFFIICQTFSMELISGKFTSYFRTGISTHSKNALVLLDLDLITNTIVTRRNITSHFRNHFCCVIVHAKNDNMN